jgi:hypothetical protein
MVDEPKNVVADKGYHSKAVILALTLAGWRTYTAEPRRGRQHREGQQAERDAVCANRARKEGENGKRLMRLRGELIERSFAHTLETGGMRRTHLRHHEKIAKRMLIHVAGFKLGLLLRKRFGFGKPRALQGLAAALVALLTVTFGRLSRVPRQLANLVAHAQLRALGFLRRPPATWLCAGPLCQRAARVATDVGREPSAQRDLARPVYPRVHCSRPTARSDLAPIGGRAPRIVGVPSREEEGANAARSTGSSTRQNVVLGGPMSLATDTEDGGRLLSLSS